MEKNYKHPIEGVVKDTLENLKNIIDISTVVGDAIKTPNGSTIIPISKVTLGYVGGGGEYNNQKIKRITPPFATGSGAGMSVMPIGFLIEDNDSVRYVQTNTTDNLNKIIGLVNDILHKINKEKDNEK